MKPMLASPVELNLVRYPVYVSPKLDGVRALVIDGKLRSRSLKTIPNKHVDALFSRPTFDGLDGEFILGSPTAPDVYRVTNAALARHDGTPDMTFYAFDLHDRQSTPFEQRVALLAARLPAIEKTGVKVVLLPQLLVKTEDQLLTVEEKLVDAGYEGVILRCPQGPYKQGRSTANEGWMLKLKRFLDSEAEIIGIEEEMHNGNVAKTNALGRTERSSHKANLVGKGTMGALIVRDLNTKVEFKIGTGFTAEDRSADWPLGKIVKYKYFPVGVKDKPRHPVYLGGREAWDL
jgi:DNA ligase-1